jgi:hypothetical protein
MRHRLHFGGEWTMIEEKTELWLELCAHAAIEQDPEKLRELARKINDLLV